MGCGGQGAQLAAPTTESTTSTSAIDYKTQYLDLVAPSNAAAEKINTMSALDTVTQDELYSAIEEAASIERVFGNGLLRAEWPDNVRQAVQDLAEAVLEVATVYDNVRNMSVSEVNEQVTPIYARISAKASVLRALLGLDPPPDLNSSTTTTVAA